MNLVASYDDFMNDHVRIGWPEFTLIAFLVAIIIGAVYKFSQEPLIPLQPQIGTGTSTQETAPAPTPVAWPPCPHGDCKG